MFVIYHKGTSASENPAGTKYQIALPQQHRLKDRKEDQQPHPDSPQTHTHAPPQTQNKFYFLPCAYNKVSYDMKLSPLSEKLVSSLEDDPEQMLAMLFGKPPEDTATAVVGQLYETKLNPK